MNEVKCPSCGAVLENGKCEYCGYTNGVENIPGKEKKAFKFNDDFQASINIDPDFNQRYNQPAKSLGVALILCALFGPFGIHYIYVGRIGMFLLYFFTAGLFGFGWIFDIIRMIVGKFPGVK